MQSDETRKIIAVYGSAATEPHEPDYAEAVALGAELARAGYGVMTGGYGGLMGAISRGAAEAGGHVIGVTVGMFKERGLIPNPFLHEEIHLPTLSARLNHLIVAPDAYVVLKGGAGTLSEFALAWSLLQVGEIPARPLIAVGRLWQQLVPHLAQEGTLHATDLRWVTLVGNGSEVLPALEAWWRNPPQIPLRLGDVKKTPSLGDPE